MGVDYRIVMHHVDGVVTPGVRSRFAIAESGKIGLNWPPARDFSFLQEIMS
jgi:hypothetical protein